MSRAITAREVPDILAAAALATAVEVGLRVLPLPRLAAAMGAPLRTHGSSVPARAGTRPRFSPADSRRLKATRRVLRHWPFGDTCLRQALVAGNRVRHLRPELVLGVARIDGTLRAHAWLEIAGAVLDPLRAAGSYAPLGAPAANHDQAPAVDPR